MPSLNRLYGRVHSVKTVKTGSREVGLNTIRSGTTYQGKVKSLEKVDGKYREYSFRTRHKVIKGQEVMFIPTLAGTAREGTVVPVTGYGST